MEGKEEIFNAVLQHFSDVYATSPPKNMAACLQQIPRLVTNEMNEALMRQVGDAEIKAVVFDLGALKAPGPNGFNGLFY